MNHQRLARLTIDIPVSEHKRLKMAASLMDVSMKQLVLMGVADFMEKKFNKVTEKALKQSKTRKSLKSFDNLDDLFDDLGI
jgi:hypothetical protein